jgi:2-oxoglutarate ferredoxin oxidoreductase subunit delta
VALGRSGILTGISQGREMAGRIVIDAQRCKGCGLCLTVCPKKNITLARDSNPSGYFPAQAGDTECTACTRCAVVCPEGVIEVLLEEREQTRIAATAAGKNTPQMVEKKR